jgi:hypothetical protein
MAYLSRIHLSLSNIISDIHSAFSRIAFLSSWNSGARQYITATTVAIKAADGIEEDVLYSSSGLALCLRFFQNEIFYDQ